MRITLLLVLIALAGCATEEQLAARRTAYIQSLTDRCMALGYPPSHPQQNQCLMRIYENDQAMYQAKQQNSLQMLGLSQGFMALGQQQPQSNSISPFTCRTLGNVTNCY